MKRSKQPRNPLPATARQADFLEAVVRLTLALGHAPNAAQIGAALGITRLGARRQLKNLEDKGLLRDVPKVVSSGEWALTEAGERARRGE